MDALSYLIQDHDKHRTLFQKTEESPEFFETLRSELIHHIDMEERVLYPLLLEAGLLESEVKNAWEEHRLLMQLLQEMDELKTGDEEWQPKFHVLKKLLLVHIDEEEKVLFPKINKNLEGKILKELTHKLLQQKESHHSDEILYPKVPHSHEKPEI